MNNTTQTTYLSVWPAFILGSLRTFTLILDADVGCGEVFPVRVGRTNMARPKVCRLGPSIAASISGGQGSWLASEPYGDRRGPTPSRERLEAAPMGLRSTSTCTSVTLVPEPDRNWADSGSVLVNYDIFLDFGVIALEIIGRKLNDKLVQFGHTSRDIAPALLIKIFHSHRFDFYQQWLTHI